MHARSIRPLAASMAFTMLLACEPTAKPKSEPHAAPAPSSSAPITAPFGANATSPNLVEDGNTAYLSWIEPSKDRKGGRVRFSPFVDGAFQAPMTVLEDEHLLVNWSDVPSIAKSTDGFVVGFSTRKGEEGIWAEIALSTDSGKTFIRKGPVHSDKSETEHGFLSLLPEKNAIRLFWLDGRALASADAGGASRAMRLYTAILRNGTIAEEQALDERVCDCCSLASAMTPDGPLVAYRDRSEDEVRDISIIRFDGATFSQPIRVHEDGFRISGCPVNGPALAARGARVVLAWYTYAQDEGRIKLSFSSDAGKHFAAPIDIAAPREGVAPLGRVDVALLESGEAVVLYQRAAREEAQLVLQRVQADGQKGAPFIVASTRADRTSGFPKMVQLKERLLVASLEGTPPTLQTKHIALADLARPMPSAETQPSSTPSAPVLAVGGSPKPLALTTLDGATLSLDDLRGKVVLINLWGTYCEPCRQEIPALIGLYSAYRKRGLEVLGISMDREKKPQEIRAFVQKREIPYLVAWDATDQASAVFGVQILPATFLLNKEGKVVWAHRGMVRKDDPTLIEAIEQALGSTRKTPRERQ